MPEAVPLLILWDIDHTLVTITGVGQEIYARAFTQVIGRPLRHLPDMAGRTEQAIVREALALNGVEPVQSFDAFYTAIAVTARSMEHQIRERGSTLPGVHEALTLFEANGAVQSLVTGNLPDVAATKLEAFGLESFIDFEVGGYGDDSSDRAVLVRLAIERAEAKYGHGFKPEHAIVIGDTPHDVKGAHDNGALAVAVATGSSSVDVLTAAGADVVLPSLLEVSVLHEHLLARRNG
jgi:phosphoglycolate phosphatase